MRQRSIALLALLLTACGTDGSVTTTLGSLPTDPAIITSIPAVALTATQPTTPPPPIEPVDQVARSITVGGMGAEYAEPVRCIVDIGVTSRRTTVEESSQAATAAASAMMDALQATGVESADIQTSEFSVGAVYGYYTEWPEITGYETRLGYRVAIPDVSGIGPILTSAIKAGGDDVTAWGIRFEADPLPLMEGARSQAWADVRARAESLASLAGEPLGEVLDIHEKVLVTSPQGMMQGGEGDSASFDIPVSPGVSGVVILLTVTFAIGD